MRAQCSAKLSTGKATRTLTIVHESPDRLFDSQVVSAASLAILTSRLIVSVLQVAEKVSSQVNAFSLHPRLQKSLKFCISSKLGSALPKIMSKVMSRTPLQGARSAGQGISASSLESMASKAAMSVFPASRKVLWHALDVSAHLNSYSSSCKRERAEEGVRCNFGILAFILRMYDLTRSAAASPTLCFSSRSFEPRMFASAWRFSEANCVLSVANETCPGNAERPGIPKEPARTCSPKD
mmetsp:Transcript_44428/g.84981  ORF Transcript_44428/g.84981 Transcript_44428/m.84981 type:complete len:239 (+) Transcript_44428:689-1405(+)